MENYKGRKMNYKTTLLNGIIWGVITVFHGLNFGFWAGISMGVATLVIIIYTSLWEKNSK